MSEPNETENAASKFDDKLQKLIKRAKKQRELLWPAVFMGVAHACLFPAVVAGGSGAFPVRYRGLGTTLMLAMFDLGNLFGAPAFGGVLRWASSAGVPRYQAAFAAVAAALAITGLIYAAFSRQAERPLRAAPLVIEPAD